MMQNNNEVMPKLMYLLKFRGRMSIDTIHYLTGFGKATIRSTLSSMIKNGLIEKVKGARIMYDLSDNSKYWLGWNKDDNWSGIKTTN